ncbi:hypothetical protein [Tenacibaculum amylolyticum]|uniref:hypothetical protein n=1 Tax=Tenacibaculum amylolyticum TaxID=104269 RepID=UPI003894DDAE
MKQVLLLYYLLCSGFITAQLTITQEFDFNTRKIEIDTEGVGEIQISTSDKIKTIRVTLISMSENTPYEVDKKEEDDVLKISFVAGIPASETTVFRKFITKGSVKASVKIEIPKNKDITILGKRVDVISKSYNGNLFILIEKGFVNFHTVLKNVYLQLFQGNVYAKVKNMNMQIQTNKGKFMINDEPTISPYKKVKETYKTTFEVNSINANIFIERN